MSPNLIAVRRPLAVRAWATALALALVAGLGLLAPAPAAAADSPQLLSPIGGVTVDTPVFRWTRVTGASGYEIVVRLTDDASIVDSAEVRSNAYTPAFAYPAGAYLWSVRPIGAGSTSAVEGFTRAWLALDGTTVVRPTLTTPVGGAGTVVPENEILLRWLPVPGASSYQVQLADERGFSPAAVDCQTIRPAATGGGSGDCGAAIQGAVDGLWSTGDTIYWRVRAIDESPDRSLVVSAWSDQATSTQPVPPDSSMSFQLGAPTANVVGPLQPAPILEPLEGGNPLTSTPNVDTPILRWNSVDGASSYKVVVARDVNFTNNVFTEITKNTSLVRAGILPFDTTARSYYWYALPCTDVDGEGTGCAPDASAINQAGKYGSFLQSQRPAPLHTPQPLGPSGTVNLGPADASIVLSWQDDLAAEQPTINPTAGKESIPGRGLVGYQVQVSTSVGFANPIIDTKVNGPFFAPTEPLPVGTYYWRVRPIDPVDDPQPLRWNVNNASDPPGQPATFSVIAPPTAPVNFVATPGVASITTAWGTPTSDGGRPITGYILRHKPTGSATWTTLALPSTARSEVINGLSAGVTYDLQVWAVNDAGEGAPAATTARVLTVPTVPQNLAVTAAAGAFTATWAPPADDGGSPVTGYELAWAPAGSGAWTVVEAASPTATVSGLTAPASYDIKVAARNALGTGPYTSLVTTLVPAGPSAPTNVVAKLKGTTATVSWKPPASDGGFPVTGYTVFHRSKVDGVWGEWTSAPVGADVFSYSVPDLTEGTKISFYVVASSALGAGAPSATVSVTLAGIPSKPRNLNAYAHKSKVELYWNKPKDDGGGITGYRIQYSKTGRGNWTKVVKNTGNAKRTYVWKKGNVGSRYSFRVAARSAAGWGPFTPGLRLEVLRLLPPRLW